MLIALSGGADSVALLLMMQERGEAQACAHCNFHLRGSESDRDERFVRRLCEERGVKLHVKHFDTRAEAARTGESIEMAARRLRYEWFDELCWRHHYITVAVAHHLDDDAETVLLNIVRGTGLRGLAGIAPERPGVVRPMLSLTRNEILNYLQLKGQDYVTDSTNADTHIRRNLLRHKVLPLLREINPRINRTLHEMALRMRGVERIYSYGIDILRKEICSPLSSGEGLFIDYLLLLASPAPKTLLYELLAPYGFSNRQIPKELKLRVGGVLDTPTRGYLLTRTTQGYEVAPAPEIFEPQFVPDTDGVFFRYNGQRIGVRHLWRSELPEIPRDRRTVALDADCLEGPLVLRPVANADRFRPYGMTGSKLVSDCLTERHYSRVDKLRAMVVADNVGIVWLVNERPAHRSAITPATARVVLLYTIDD